MGQYDFSVIATGVDPGATDFEARFHAAGCDDATVAFQRGLVIVDFSREAQAACAAVSDAVAAVRRAGALVLRVEPDPLVPMAEVSQRTGIPAGVIAALSKSDTGSRFPLPVACVTTDTPLWNWVAVSLWLSERGVLDMEACRLASAIASVNQGLPVAA